MQQWLSPSFATHSAVILSGWTQIVQRRTSTPQNEGSAFQHNFSLSLWLPHPTESRDLSFNKDHTCNGAYYGSGPLHIPTSPSQSSRGILGTPGLQMKKPRPSDWVTNPPSHSHTQALIQVCPNFVWLHRGLFLSPEWGRRRGAPLTNHCMNLHKV